MIERSDCTPFAVVFGFEMVPTILRFAMKPEALPAMPTEEAILRHLQKFGNEHQQRTC